MTTFESDGYRDALLGNPPAPPDIRVLSHEYLRGYRIAASERLETLLADVRDGNASAAELTASFAAFARSADL